MTLYSYGGTFTNDVEPYKKQYELSVGQRQYAEEKTSKELYASYKKSAAQTNSLLKEIRSQRAALKRKGYSHFKAGKILLIPITPYLPRKKV